jgi:glycogen debranching enzyme
MSLTFKRTYNPSKYFRENRFRHAAPQQEELPAYERIRDHLPRPIWDGHDSAIACYWKAWELAFRHLRQPTYENGFIANYIDTAYNDNIFMWDSVFMLMFGRYADRVFNFQRTLDNFYAKQHPDGFICREIRGINGHDCFQRFDPTATGPNILAWSEWTYYQNFNDKERLAAVFPVLAAYHQWMATYRTWPSGGYWASGWACGMDNQPRIDKKYNVMFGHGHLTWIDTCLQQLLSGRLLVQMANEIGRAAETEEWLHEIDHLAAMVNNSMWDDHAAFYFDLKADGTLSDVKTIGAFWALLADIVPADRLAPFIAHLENPSEFNRPHRVASLSADHPRYRQRGQYWLGGVWAPTNYMVLKGLNRVDHDALAFEIAANHLNNVVKIFERTQTLWENYAPELLEPGMPAKPDFVGWTGLSPIAVLFENIFGLRPAVPNAELTWDICLLERHGVYHYPFGKNGHLDLICEQRKALSEKPNLIIHSTTPLTLNVRWHDGREQIKITAENK